VAIALSIIGLLSGFFVTKTITVRKIMRMQVTKNNIEAVSLALVSFLVNNNRLPYPSLDFDGREGKISEYNLSSYVGGVPFHVLGIPAKIALDGEGKRLIYVVDPFFTLFFQKTYDDGKFDRNLCDGFSDPKIIIDGIALTTQNPVVFVIVIDNKDNLRVSEKIHIVVEENTYWVSRDMLLMQYLKSAPCRREITPQALTPATPAAPTGSVNPFDAF
jgi:hypothetical protein